MTPPHVEHGALGWGMPRHENEPPTAELRVKLLFRTCRNELKLWPIDDRAPPFDALQSVKWHCVTVMLLLNAERAPPLPLGFVQF